MAGGVSWVCPALQGAFLGQQLLWGLAVWGLSSCSCYGWTGKKEVGARPDPARSRRQSLPR